MTTPLRDALRRGSRLGLLVVDGLKALKTQDKQLIDEQIRSRFADSIDIDIAFIDLFPNENRWDYLLGDKDSASVFALEPHSAKLDEVSTVVAKKERALVQLREHLKPARRVARWFWASSGAVHFPDTDRVMLRLAQANIVFVGKILRKKHLD
jgi:hypothetical protein